MSVETIRARLENIVVRANQMPDAIEIQDFPLGIDDVRALLAVLTPQPSSVHKTALLNQHAELMKTAVSLDMPTPPVGSVGGLLSISINYAPGKPAGINSFTVNTTPETAARFGNELIHKAHATTNCMPMQPIITDPHGVWRFKRNRIVDDMLEYATPLGFSMNSIALKDYTPEERMQFAQLVGYSVRGYGDLSYVTDESYSEAVDLVAEDGDDE